MAKEGAYPREQSMCAGLLGSSDVVKSKMGKRRGIFLRLGKELGSMGWQNAKQRTTGKSTGQENASLPLSLLLKKKNGGRGKFIKVSSAKMISRKVHLSVKV